MGGSGGMQQSGSSTETTQLSPKYEALLGFNKNSPEYSPFKALSRQGGTMAKMIEGMTTRPTWSSMYEAYGAKPGTDLTPYIQATRQGTRLPEAPIPSSPTAGSIPQFTPPSEEVKKKAASGGLMSLRKFAAGGDSAPKDISKAQAVRLERLNNVAAASGRLTPQQERTRQNLNRQRTAYTTYQNQQEADRAPGGGIPLSQAMNVVTPFYDVSQQYGQYGGVTNPIYQQALDQLRAVSQAPSQVSQGTNIMSDAANRLMGMSSYSPQQVEAAKIARGDIRDVAAQQAQVERMTGARNVRGATMSGPESWTQQGVAAQYMNPYTQNVLDQELFEANRQAQMRENQQRSQAAQQHAFGGTRAALQESEGRRNLGYTLADIESKGLQQAYGQGMQQFLAEQGLGQQAKQTNVGSLNQAALANQLYGTGGFQAQAANQAAQNQAYNNYVQQQLTAQGMNQGMDWNTASQNATMQMQAMLANQQAGLQANAQNISAASGAGQMGQGIGALGNQTWGLQQNIPQMWGAAGQTVQNLAQQQATGAQQTAQNWYGGMQGAYAPATNLIASAAGRTTNKTVSQLPGIS